MLRIGRERERLRRYRAVAARWLALGLSLCAAAGARAAADPLQERVLMSTGVERSYVLHVPRGGERDTRRPLVIVLHGAGGSGRNVLEQGGWVEKANGNAFIVAAPDGTTDHEDRRAGLLSNPRTWNAGPESGSPAERRGVNDVAFIRDLISELIRREGVDPDRVYATGFSNGAAMAFRVGAELSDLVAAVAPVSNALLVPVERLARPVSLLLIWGTADPLNPIGGGKVKRGGRIVERPSAASSWALWGRALHCRSASTPQIIAVGVMRQALTQCDDGADAALITIDGLGHQWPGGQIYVRSIAGPGSKALNATDRIWDFFRAHRRLPNKMSPT